MSTPAAASKVEAMLAQLCSSLLGHSDKGRNQIRRHSCSSLNVQFGDGACLNRENLDSDYDEETQGPDLLQGCPWDVNGQEEPLYASVMGQRASSVSSLHEPLRRGGVAPPQNRVSLTWALKQSHQVSTNPAPPPQQPTPSLPPPSTSSCGRRTPSTSTSRSSVNNFGYDINDIDEFLSKASLQNPANIPVVVASACVLYQPGRGRSGRGWRQTEVALPLGTVVNAVFRVRGWLYVHTPHGDAGYVRYRVCLPLGILPSRPASAWDSPAFPPPPPPREKHRTRRPRTPANKTDAEKLTDEAAVDSLFLAAQAHSGRRSRASVETLLRHAHRSRSAALDAVSVKDSVSQVGYATKPKHKIEKLQLEIEENLRQIRPMHRTIALQTDFEEEADSVLKDSMSEVGGRRQRSRARSRGVVSECGRSEVQMKTETLLLIRSDYNSRGRNTLSVSRGDVVVLVSSRLKDWFWVRRTDGCEGFIPAVVAGHGFL